jgi:hypothetical protein
MGPPHQPAIESTDMKMPAFSGRQIWSAVTRHRFGFGSEFRRQPQRKNHRIEGLNPISVFFT